MQIFVFLQPMWRQVQSGVSDSRTFQPQGSYREKNTRKNMKFWPLNSFIKRPDWKTYYEKDFLKLWHLSFKIKEIHAAEARRNAVKLNYVYNVYLSLYNPPTPNTHHPSHGFFKNLPQLHLRYSYVRFSGKNKVDNTTWGKSCDLIGQKRQNSFQ